MALSLGNRQQTHATKSNAQRQNSFNSNLTHKWPAAAVRKQNSFIEIGSTKVLHLATTASNTTTTTTNHIEHQQQQQQQQRPTLTVSRSIDNLQQKILMPLAKQRKSNGSALSKQYSIDRIHLKQQQQLTQTTTTTTAASRKLTKNFSYCDALFTEANERKNDIIKKQNEAWLAAHNNQTTTTTTTSLKNSPNFAKATDVNRNLNERLKRNYSNAESNYTTNGIYKNNNSNSNTDACINQQRSTENSQYNKSSTLSKTATSNNGSFDNGNFKNSNNSNKINLNIVLTQTIKATTENEYFLSDAEGSFEINDQQPINEATKVVAESERKSNVTPPNSTTSATQKRAQFHISRGLVTTTIQQVGGTITPTIQQSQSPTAVGKAQTAVVNSQQITASPSLIIQKRPPLVRAMSAPVRSFDENSKNILGANKRKPRRRKFNARAINSDRSPDDTIAADEKDFLGEANDNKKQLSRSRTLAAPDLVTLVTLVSSEGSDSEREDNSSAQASATNSDTTPPRRAPLLRKTGKSVSFQENFPPNFQLATKEYSHMLRRGSILPLAARLRSNRPPTAPPVSIFLNDSNKTQNMTAAGSDSSKQQTLAVGETQAETAASNSLKENKIKRAISLQVQDYDYPSYVRSLKEKECWKLYQKMSDKGVNVAYDTVARGMLTPTEFRQLQKQREQEEDKARAEAEEANKVEEVKKPASAIERLSESLLQKKGDVK